MKWLSELCKNQKSLHYTVVFFFIQKLLFFNSIYEINFIILKEVQSQTYSIKTVKLGNQKHQESNRTNSPENSAQQYKQEENIYNNLQNNNDIPCILPWSDSKYNNKIRMKDFYLKKKMIKQIYNIMNFHLEISKP